MLSRLVADVTPLRSSPAFRRFWVANVLSGAGSMMTVFAVALQVYLLTHSSAAVGLIGLVDAAPGIACGLLAGGLVDAMDRRVLVLITSTLQLAVSAAFAAQAFAALNNLAVLYVLVAVQSVVGAVNAPAKRTFMPRLLPAEQVPAGAALTMLGMHTAMVGGPSLAGVVAAAGGLKLCYAVDAASFLIALYAVYRLPAMRPVASDSRPGLGSVVAGWRFLRHNPVLGGVLLADLNATVLAMPIALFPAVNAQRFGGSPTTLGLLTTAVAVGGILGSGLSGPLSRVRRQGRGVLLAGAAWGAALAGFGVVHGLVATLALLVVAGSADVSSVVLRTSILQVATPDAFRGRVSATEYVVGAACPELGNFRAGAVASLTSPGVSAVSGGLACVAGAGLLALAVPALVRYRTGPAPVPLAAAQATT
jgi:predicted MFS family arabinose efflux permease